LLLEHTFQFLKQVLGAWRTFAAALKNAPSK
jgi:hypothetical protein